METGLAGELEAIAAKGPPTPMGKPEPDSGDEETQNGVLSEVPPETDAVPQPVPPVGQKMIFDTPVLPEQQLQQQPEAMVTETSVIVEQQQQQQQQQPVTEVPSDTLGLHDFDLNTFIDEARKNSEDQFTAFKRQFIHNHDIAMQRCNNEDVALEFSMTETEVVFLVDRFKAGSLMT